VGAGLHGLQSNHWAQLFKLLGMPTKGNNAVTKENLTVDHFLDKADMLVKHGEEIKHLHAQAQGEFTLREALRTLQIWGFERDFVLLNQVRRTALF
jgi:dynein heavy chain 2